MARKVKIGDIIEVKVDKGYSYAQLTHFDDDLDAFICIFEKVYKSKIEDCIQIANFKTLFRKYYHLQYSVNKKFVKIIGNVPVRKGLKNFPNTRNRMNVDKNGYVRSWYISEKKRNFVVEELNSEQKDYPIAGLISHPLLLSLINKQLHNRDLV